MWNTATLHILKIYNNNSVKNVIRLVKNASGTISRVVLAVQIIPIYFKVNVYHNALSIDILQKPV